MQQLIHYTCTSILVNKIHWLIYDVCKSEKNSKYINICNIIFSKIQYSDHQPIKHAYTSTPPADTKPLCKEALQDNVFYP